MYGAEEELAGRGERVGFVGKRRWNRGYAVICDGGVIVLERMTTGFVLVAWCGG